jgi:TerC family integral membrane protein
MQSISEWWMWLSFLIFVLLAITADLYLLGGKKSHRVSTKEAFTWTIAWIALAILFNFILWRYLTHTAGSSIATEKALEFFTGYLIEKSLSVDNLFVFVVLFRYFSVPVEYQKRVLLFGVLGAIILRLALILLGVSLISAFHWVLYLFGIFLIITGIKMAFTSKEKFNFNNNAILRWTKSRFRFLNEFHQEKFFVIQNKIRYATPLFLVLILIEVNDLIFALDSIPAIFAVTTDSFIVFTSNIFAILGLRSLYFLLANAIDRFHLLKYALALTLVFVGVKMLIEPWLHIPVIIALAVIIVILAAGILFSISAQIDE